MTSRKKRPVRILVEFLDARSKVSLFGGPLTLTKRHAHLVGLWMLELAGRAPKKAKR